MPIFSRNPDLPEEPDPDVVFLADIRQRLVDIVDDIDGYISAATPPSDANQDSGDGVSEENNNE